MTHGRTIPVRRPERPKKRRQQQQRQQSIYQWLRERTSPIDFGKKVKGRPVHCNKNKKVLDAFANGQWLERMTNKKFDSHFSGQETFYFTANSRCRASEILVMIDIDCHKSGTLTGALAFAEHLRTHHFPNLYFEVSTNGNGVHAFPVLKKSGLDGKAVNERLRRLDQHLKNILAETLFDVELVEVKGTCPVLAWGEKRGELLNYRSGQLGKLPRERHRFEELKKTTRIWSFDLLRLPPVLEPARNTESRRSNKIEGSISGRLFSDDELGQLKGHYRHVAQTLLQNHPLRTSSRAIAIADDVAIFLMLLRFITGHMNSDEVFRKSGLRNCGPHCSKLATSIVPFEDKRFASIRNYLSSLGLIDWQDATYRIGWVDDQGQYHWGRAARWKASEKLMDMLKWESRRRIRRRESILYRNTTSSRHKKPRPNAR